MDDRRVMTPPPPARMFVRAHREARRLSPGQLAAVSGVPRVTVWRMEAERVHGVDFANLGRIAAALGCHPGDLFRPPAVVPAAPLSAAG